MTKLHYRAESRNSENADQCARLLARWESRGIHAEALTRVRERAAWLASKPGDVRPSTFSYGGRI